MLVPDLRMQPGPHVFVDSLESPVLGDGDHHHLSRALRLRAGDPFTLSDAQGNWCTAVFGDRVDPTGVIHHIDARPDRLGLGIALTKAAKPEFVVQKATEIGIDDIFVFPAEHSVARWDEAKRSRNESRLKKVAREAAMQSRRVRIPTVEVAASLEPFIGRAGVARADFGGIPTKSDHRIILIGPEGGWSESERASIPDAVDLGSTVLRAETAAVVASAFLVKSVDRSD